MGLADLKGAWVTEGIGVTSQDLIADDNCPVPKNRKFTAAWRLQKDTTGGVVKNSYYKIPDWVATGPVEHVPALPRSNKHRLQRWDDFPWSHRTLPAVNKVSQSFSMGSTLENKFAGAERCASVQLIYYRLEPFGIISLFTARLLTQAIFIKLIALVISF
ncbi:hypothetical protein BG015_011101 [Linnemannia schmuckeri]|uniref:Uncharacterized protein n=1 Tax=Linnemannia schmuckeri TaxID=64567 RepID=A0A9P5V8M4_9FUNG|nr:hypothetical protein BG015_011101 [Linnemannia schmuckeri]